VADMGETKPKIGAKNIVDYHPIDPAVIDEIKRKNPTINFDKVEGAVEDLKRAFELFLARRELSLPENRVRRSNVTAALKAMLHKGTGAGPLPALIKMLKGMDPSTKSFLKKETGLAENSDPTLVGYFTIKDLVVNLEILNEAVLEGYEKMLNKKKDKGGRPSDKPLYYFLNKLWPIYKKCTGKSAKRAYNSMACECYGPFPEFVHSCVTALEVEKFYPLETIHSAIQRHIKS
jgi:hypothetical protein